MSPAFSVIPRLLPTDGKSWVLLLQELGFGGFDDEPEMLAFTAGDQIDLGAGRRNRQDSFGDGEGRRSTVLLVLGRPVLVLLVLLVLLFFLFFVSSCSSFLPCLALLVLVLPCSFFRTLWAVQALSFEPGGATICNSIALNHPALIVLFSPSEQPLSCQAAAFHCLPLPFLAFPLHSTTFLAAPPSKA